MEFLKSQAVHYRKIQLNSTDQYSSGSMRKGSNANDFVFKLGVQYGVFKTYPRILSSLEDIKAMKPVVFSWRR